MTVIFNWKKKPTIIKNNKLDKQLLGKTVKHKNKILENTCYYTYMTLVCINQNIFRVLIKKKLQHKKYFGIFFFYIFCSYTLKHKIVLI